MKQNDVKQICSAAMLRYDDRVADSLSVIGEMMEEVVCSELCESSVWNAPEGEAVLRPDEVNSLFTRDEMLSCVGQRKGSFAAVPRIIE